ncbi:biotin carboxyl carrier protein of acetyl-CoA carboxylase, chloroplastic [Syzygium oleosum]|uniref:biotin carboxyl carrier protein of acetyl-CoA carboxylase, chloroplastic n=1 Tax=Syzygium oleosum TaxID=219896 RepID=UPI0024B9E894|nr:biotin carboxyl carrier protein of acetyl-CoA carboxylase, chloroplastic [Syzygium oleosum]
MASSLSTAAAASTTLAAKASASRLPRSPSLPPPRGCPPDGPRALSFRLSPNKPKLRFLARGLHHTSRSSAVVKAQSKEVAADGSSNAATTPPSKPAVPASETKDAQPPVDPSSASVATKESISEFISQVSNLVKLVDSRDIVELQLKQLDCELIIRKKEALPQPPAPAPSMMIHAPSPVIGPPAPVAPAPVAPTAPRPPPPSASKPAESSLPPLKCPMAGTFYRSPGPGEPPFVKKGDKVQKGQVVCIIEAMKLMNEIEADQSGTIVDVLAEDCKPVSVDTPLFVIQP